jgi:N-acetylmuramoyl-L-alanine amidase
MTLRLEFIMKQRLIPFLLCVISLLFITFTATPASAELLVEHMRFSSEQSGGKTTEIIEFTTDNPAALKIFTLQNPPRVVIDLPVFRWRVPNSQLQSYSGSLLRQVRYARHSDTTSRIVLDMQAEVEPQLLSQSPATTHRIRLVPQGASAAAAAPAASGETLNIPNRGREVEQVQTKEGTLGRIAEEENNAPTATASNNYPIPRLKPGTGAHTTASAPAATPRTPIVVIDAGHGGQDPGAVGQRGTHEKVITLAFAQSLKHALEKSGRYKVVLTRDKDFFIPLRQRVQIARKAKGDMFISLHADSAPGAQVRGLSVYSLSETASDSEAAKLAASENKADIINGVDLSGASKDVTDILIDLTQRSTMARSAALGEQLLTGIQRAGVRTLSKPHRYAGFAVLKAPDIPSALVELGFLSHPEEETLLQTASHRSQIVEGLVKGIDSYFTQTTTKR